MVLTAFPDSGERDGIGLDGAEADGGWILGFCPETKRLLRQRDAPGVQGIAVTECAA